MEALLCLALVLTAARPAAAQAIQDSRCYLMSGGAVESFFISEDTPVGSIIGTLSVNGDPSEKGDISLRVQERRAAVALVPGSKNITLTRALDREELSGPSSVYVNVRCDRRHTSDPSFVIPVSVRVWDVNDNAPSWSGAPYRTRVSELAAVGTRVLTVRAHDPDQPGPHATVRYAVLPGPGAEYVWFPSELDGALVVRRPLDYETLANVTVAVRALDGGSPPRHNDTTVTLQLLDADDQNPAFTSDHYAALLPPDAAEGDVLQTSPGPIAARDQDEGIDAPVTYSVRPSAASNASLVRLHRDSGALFVTAELLHAALPVTLVIQATQVDNPDRYALATLDVTRAGTGRVQFPRRSFRASVREDAAPGDRLLALEAQGQGPLQYYVSERSFLEQFAINEAGEVLLRRALDRDTRQYTYQVMVTDGRTNDTAVLQMALEDVNEWEPRFKEPQYAFRVTADEARGPGCVRVGRVDVHDGDPEDRVSVTAEPRGAVTVSEDGHVCVDAAALAPGALHAVLTARDSGEPPRQSSVPLSVWVSAPGPSAGALSALGAPVCAAAAALLLLAAALVFLYRLRRKRQVCDDGASARLPEKTAPASSSLSSVASEAGGAGAGGAPGSERSASAGASSILAASATSLEPPAAPAASAAAAPGALSDHLRGAAAGRSGVAWPSATIPARVTRLSWGRDERRSDEADLTVYF